MKKVDKKGPNRLIKMLSGHFSQLLTSLVILFVLRPYDWGPLYIAIWQVFFVIAFLAAIFNCDHSRKVQITAAIFGVPAMILQWANLYFSSKLLLISFLICFILFIFITTSSIIKRVIINARVKPETLRGVICAYFMLAFGFSFIYLLIDVIQPGSFHITPELGTTLSYSHYLSEMMYFSFVTILTIGYGDINAVKDVGQTFAVLEGIIGQFYIAILVSRLVSVYSYFEHKLHLVKPDEKKT